MIFNRKKTLYDKNVLQEAGVIDCSRKSIDSDVILFTTDMTTLSLFWEDIDSQRFIGRFRWKGLPKNNPPERVEQMLYFRGSLALFKVGKDFFILPYTQTGGINVLGLPNKIYPVTYNGEKPGEPGTRWGDFELAIDNNGVYRDDRGNVAVLLFDRFNNSAIGKQYPRALLSQPIIHEICNRLAYLKINLINSQGKYVIVCKDEKTQKVIEESLDEMLASTKPYQLIRSMFEVQVIQNKVEFMEQQLWEDITSWNSLLCEAIGIPHSDFFNKKERKITGEIDGQNVQTDNILNNGLYARQLFVERVKEAFADDEDFKTQFGSDFGVELATMETYTADSEEEDESGENELDTPGTTNNESEGGQE